MSIPRYLILAVLLTFIPSISLKAEEKKHAVVKPTISLASVDSRNWRVIHVVFDVPVPAVGDIPPAKDWQIYQQIEPKDQSPSFQQIQVDGVDTSRFEAMHMIVLRLSAPVSKDASTVNIRIIAPKYILELPEIKPPAKDEKPDPQRFEEADERNDSDIYFDGSYASASGSSAVYNVDAFAGYMEGIQSKDKRTLYGKVGAYGQVKTTDSSTINPNSFLLYGVYQRVLSGSAIKKGNFQAPIFNARVAGAEFSLKGTQLNFVTSPIVTFPIQLTNMARHGVQRPGILAPHLDVTVGAEIVDVLKSALAPTGEWHTRGLVAATASGGYKPPDPSQLFDSFKVSASYQLRLPSSPEIFYDPKFAVKDPITGASTTPAMLGKQPRHYIDAMFCYNFVKWAGATFETEYGSLPPAFNKTPTTYTLGLTFSLKQKSYGRTSILRP